MATFQITIFPYSNVYCGAEDAARNKKNSKNDRNLTYDQEKYTRKLILLIGDDLQQIEDGTKATFRKWSKFQITIISFRVEIFQKYFGFFLVAYHLTTYPKIKQIGDLIYQKRPILTDNGS